MRAFMSDGRARARVEMFTDRRAARESAVAEASRVMAHERLPGVYVFNAFDWYKLPQSDTLCPEFDRAAFAALRETLSAFVGQHNTDEDCTVDAVTLCCVVCGVDHGGTCDACGGHGFHKAGCPESDANRKDDRS